MGDYRHDKHAGNFADVHKHVLLRMLIREMKKQPGPITYIETHAGAGWYDLQPGGEWEDGIGRLFGRDDLPEPVADYVSACRDGYPGSPMHAAELLGEKDRLVLVEREADVAQQLKARLNDDSRCMVECNDGYSRARELILKMDSRTLLMVDPPYVDDADYIRVSDLVNHVAQKRRQIILAAWYPRWQNGRELHLHALIMEKVRQEILDLVVSGQRCEMSGSGFIIFDAPTTLSEISTEMNHWLAQEYS